MRLVKISACLIVYNEEKVIKRCLDSIRNIADEIIIVHDGPCSDRTLDICKKYTKKIFVRKHIGEAEPHRPFALKKAKGKWVLVLDADEYLSKESQENIKGLIQSKGVDGYRFIWSIYYRGKKVSFGPLSRLHRLILFRKNRIIIRGIIYDWYRVSGCIRNVNLVIEHKPVNDSYTYKQFKKKDLKWAFIQAKRQIKEKGIKYSSFFYIFKAILLFLYCLFYFIFVKFYFINGFLGIKFSFFEAMYNFNLKI